MDVGLALSEDARRLAGILFIAVVLVQYGGYFILKVVTGSKPAADFQLRFFRAGHAHAGVLVVLGLICQIYVDAANLSGFLNTFPSSGVPVAAILMPMGFFFSAGHHNATVPSRWILLVYLGAASLAAGVFTLGVGLLTA